MSTDIVILVVGGFVTLALGINAFFLRGIFKDLGDVKINIAKIFERSKAKEKRIVDNEEDIKEIFKRLNKLESEK